MPMPTYLFPPIEPYATGHLRVDDIHTLYWEESGNPNGVPVVFLHGGPGAGSSPTHRRFFNPENWRIIIFDQRGAGHSTPLGETRQNTTDLLIEDIETLRIFREIDKWHVFGGSWGSTLAIAYAIAHPEVVKSLTLRGICLLQKREIDWFFYGIRSVFPEAWLKFNSFIAPFGDENILESYWKILNGPDRALARQASEVWLNYETSCSTLLPAEETLAQTNPPPSPRSALSVLEAHYFRNNLFTPDDYLLQNIDRIRHIPATIIQGRYDMVCPIITADELHAAWPEAEYQIIPDAGHSALEPNISKALVAATEKFKNLP